jgi:hypothetical protein
MRLNTLKHKVKLTLKPLNKNDVKLYPDIWRRLEVLYDNPFGTSLLKDKKDKGDYAAVTTETTAECHHSLLIVSALYPTVVFETIVECPDGKDKFKVFYHGGKTQCCKALKEQFSVQKLI